MARIAIVGVGAIGGAVAALLTMAERHEITLCTRRPLPQLTVDLSSKTVHVKAENATVPESAKAVEWVMVATKAYDADGAAKWFPALCAEGAQIAVLQNGVEHRERFAPYIEQARLLPVVVDFPAERVANGTVRVTGTIIMRVESTVLGREFATLFAGTSANIEPVNDFVTGAWKKLCLNSVGALNAITLKPAGVLRDKKLEQLALAMMAECIAVGRADGAQLSDSLGEEILAHYRRQPPTSVNSLLADRLAGKRMETDARNGAVVRKRERHGIPTPLNRMAVALLDATKWRETS